MPVAEERLAECKSAFWKSGELRRAVQSSVFLSRFFLWITHYSPAAQSQPQPALQPLSKFTLENSLQPTFSHP